VPGVTTPSSIGILVPTPCARTDAWGDGLRLRDETVDPSAGHTETHPPNTHSHNNVHTRKPLQHNTIGVGRYPMQQTRSTLRQVTDLRIQGVSPFPANSKRTSLRLRPFIAKGFQYDMLPSATTLFA
jgi:hypothetical protein